MKLLLDTHTVIWWDNDELPATVQKRIQRADVVLVSAVTAWEIAIKSALGKMKEHGSVEALLADYGFIELPIQVRHADQVRTLPDYHRDPFDRMLVAQAMVEDLVIVSKDVTLKRYPAAVVWE